MGAPHGAGPELLPLLMALAQAHKGQGAPGAAPGGPAGGDAISRARKGGAHQPSATDSVGGHAGAMPITDFPRG